MGHLSDYLKQHDRLAGVSVRGFAKLVGISPDTASQILNKDRAPEDETLRKIADALPASVQKLRRLTQQDRMAGRQLPEEAAWLDDDEWKLMLELIAQFAKHNRSRLPATPPATPEIGDTEAGSRTASVTQIDRKGDDTRQRVTRAAYKPPPRRGK